MFQEQFYSSAAVVSTLGHQTASRDLARAAARSSGVPRTSHHATVATGVTDMTGCDAIRSFFERCTDIITSGSACLILDLDRVRHADTKLMACLVAIMQNARTHCVNVELWASEGVLEMIDFCRLRWLLEE